MVNATMVLNEGVFDEGVMREWRGRRNAGKEVADHLLCTRFISSAGLFVNLACHGPPRDVEIAPSLGIDGGEKRLEASSKVVQTPKYLLAPDNRLQER